MKYKARLAVKGF